jgi:hypothetical protein
MARKPKPVDYKVLRRLHDAAGSRKELNRWIGAALSEKQGTRGPKEIDSEIDLLTYEVLLRMFREGLPRKTIIRELVKHFNIPGQSVESTTERILRKLNSAEQRRKFGKKVVIKDHPNPDKVRYLIRDTK